MNIRARLTGKLTSSKPRGNALAAWRGPHPRRVRNKRGAGRPSPSSPIRTGQGCFAQEWPGIPSRAPWRAGQGPGPGFHSQALPSEEAGELEAGAFTLPGHFSLSDSQQTPTALTGLLGQLAAQALPTCTGGHWAGPGFWAHQ